MNEKQLDLAVQILSEGMLKQIQKNVQEIAQDIMGKFNDGPKPKLDQHADINFAIRVQGKTLYEIEKKVHVVMGGNRYHNFDF